MTNVKHRVTLKIEGKKYDLRPSQNPHEKLPKKVIDALKAGGHLADEVPAAAASNGNAPELATANAEISQLKADAKKAAKELEEAQDKITALTEDNTALKAEIEELKKPK